MQVIFNLLMQGSQAWYATKTHQPIDKNPIAVPVTPGPEQNPSETLPTMPSTALVGPTVNDFMTRRAGPVPNELAQTKNNVVRYPEVDNKRAYINAVLSAYTG